MKRYITDVTWFNDSLTCIGIVITRDEKTYDDRAYICAVEGNSKRSDIIYVAQHGAKFPLAAALIIMKNHGQVLIPPIELNP